MTYVLNTKIGNLLDWFYLTVVCRLLKILQKSRGTQNWIINLVFFFVNIFLNLKP